MFSVMWRWHKGCYAKRLMCNNNINKNKSKKKIKIRKNKYRREKM